MAEYYLIAQLPTLDGLSEGAPIPITEESFLELCNRFLSKKAVKEIESLTLIPPLNFEKSTSFVVNEWNNGERTLRLALAMARAEKQNKTFDIGNNVIPSEAIKVANDALEKENPLEAENFLLAYRLKFLETLSPINNFSNEFITYYALKLKLLYRIRKFDTEVGRKEYTKIYNSIKDGESLEVRQ